MTEQQQELKRNADALARQTFESTFFQLVRLLNDVRDGTLAPVFQNATNTGRPAFSDWATRVRDAMPTTCDASAINTAYTQYYMGTSADILGHYFRTVYVVLKFVDDSPIADKRMYTRIVRAQMSSSELVVLFYNALSQLGREKMLPLLEKYDIFDNLSVYLLKNANQHTLVKSNFAEHAKVK